MPWNSPSAAKLRMNNYEFATSTDLDFASLSTTTMYRERHGQNAYDRDATSIEYVRQLVAEGKVAPGSVASVLAGDYGLGGNQTDTARIFYQDVHLTGEKIGGFSWVAGAEYYLLRDRPRSVLGKTATAASPSPGTIDVAQERFESYAVYGSASYDLTEKLNLAADLRVTHDTEDFVSRRLDYGTRLPIASTAFSVAGGIDDTNVSYTVSASYKPVAEWLLYAKVGSGYRPGGFNTSLGDPRQPIPVPTSYDPETLTSYEVGFKGNLASNLYVTAAAYDNEFKDLIIQGNNGCFLGNPACPVQQTVFAFNAGPASLWGFEIEATARFEVLGGALRITAGGSRQGGKIGGSVYDGLRQPQQPDWTATYNINYRHDLANGASAFANLKGSGRWGGVQEVAQTPPLDDYLISDARLGVEWGRYELALHAENVFDQTYVVFAAPSVTNNVIRYNFPRTYGVELRYTW
jgi:iron complex outermembrane receptor protein